MSSLYESSDEKNDWFKKKSLRFKDSFVEEEERGRPEVRPKSEEEAGKMYAALEKVTLFQVLESEEVRRVVEVLEEVEVEREEVVVRQGEELQRMYLVESGGALEEYIVVEGGRVNRGRMYKGGGVVGAEALVAPRPAPAHLKALVPGRLYTLNRPQFKAVLLAAGTNPSPDLFNNLLGSVPMFRVLRPLERSRLKERLVLLHYQAGERVLKEGDPPYGLYFLLQGSCMAAVPSSPNREIEVMRYKRNEMLGLIGLTRRLPRLFNVYAVTKCRLAFLDVTSFSTLLAPCMDILARIEREMLDALPPPRSPHPPDTTLRPPKTKQ